MNYKVETDQYKGPLEKLLELVKEDELDISLISLARVTEGFLGYLESLKEQEIPHRILADFLVIASKLLLIKSKVIIPTLEFDEEEEEDMEELELQLKLYDKIKGAREHLEKQWSDQPQIRGRQFLMIKETFFHPPENLKASDLHQAIKEVVNEIEKLVPVERIKRKVVTLQSKIEDILRQVTNAATNVKSFSNNNTKGELIVLFLAVLHLFKDQLIDLDQESNFGEINIVKK